MSYTLRAIVHRRIPPNLQFASPRMRSKKQERTVTHFYAKALAGGAIDVEEIPLVCSWEHRQGRTADRLFPWPRESRHANRCGGAGEGSRIPHLPAGEERGGLGARISGCAC